MENAGSMFQITANTDIIKKLPSPIYKIAAQTFIDREFPRHIFVETTANCQLNCDFCPRQKRQENMDYELFKSIIDEGTQYGPRSWSLHLFGEPLLYPKIIDAIRYIKHKNRKHTVLLTTNGILLNRFERALCESGVDRIIWSWRKEAHFNTNSIRLLREIGLIRLLIEETPKEEFEKWKTFPRVEIKHLHNYGGNIDVSKWRDKTSDLDILFPLASEQVRYPCYHLWLAPAIRWNGEITICCNDPNGMESLGVYGQLSLDEVWMGSKLKDIREGHLKGEYKGLCKDCNVWKTYPDMFFGFQKKNGHEH